MKKFLMPAGIFLLILISAFILIKRLSTSKPEVTIVPTPTIILPTITSDITVDLIPSQGNRQVALIISGFLPDVTSIEYELTYTTGSGLPRGVLGKINIADDRQVTRNDIVLGTCSSGKCVYDSGVTAIDLSLKFNSSKGMSVFRKTYPL